MDGTIGDDAAQCQADEYYEWLHGELEYYQELCNEIYPPTQNEDVGRSLPDVEEFANDEEGDTEGIASDTEADTTCDISFGVNDAEEFASDDEDTRLYTE